LGDQLFFLVKPEIPEETGSYVALSRLWDWRHEVHPWREVKGEVIVKKDGAVILVVLSPFIFIRSVGVSGRLEHGRQIALNIGEHEDHHGDQQARDQQDWKK
jgi:hypothetical protein